MDRHKLLFILLAALLTAAALTALVSLSRRTEDAQKTITVTKQNGVYDLTGIPDLEKAVVTLAPGNTDTGLCKRQAGRASRNHQAGMELWLAVLLLFVFAGAFSALLLYSFRKKKMRFMVGLCVLGAALLVLIIYIALTFLFLDRVSS